MSRNHRKRSLLNVILKYVLISFQSSPWRNAAHQVKKTVTTDTWAAVLSQSSTAARWEEAGRDIFRLDSQNQAATFHHFTRTQQQNLWKCQRERERPVVPPTTRTGRVGVFILHPGEQTVGSRFWLVYWSNIRYLAAEVKFLMIFFTQVLHQTSFSFWTIYLEEKLR